MEIEGIGEAGSSRKTCWSVTSTVGSLPAAATGQRTAVKPSGVPPTAKPSTSKALLQSATGQHELDDSICPHRV